MENMDWVRYFWIALSWSFWGWFMLLVVFLVGLVIRFFWKIVFPPYSSPSTSFRDYTSTIEESDTWDDIRCELKEEQKKEWEDDDYLLVDDDGDDDDEDEDNWYRPWNIFR